MKSKRILAGALAAIMTFGLIGCGNVEKNSSNSKSTAAEPEESSMTVETESSSPKKYIPANMIPRWNF